MKTKMISILKVSLWCTMHFCGYPKEKCPSQVKKWKSILFGKAPGCWIHCSCHGQFFFSCVTAGFLIQYMTYVFSTCGSWSMTFWGTDHCEVVVFQTAKLFHRIDRGNCVIVGSQKYKIMKKNTTESARWWRRSVSGQVC